MQNLLSLIPEGFKKKHFLERSLLTLRENTERPENSLGTNQLIDTNYSDFEKKLDLALSNIKEKKFIKIPLWDGATSKRIKIELLNHIKDK